MALQRRPRVPKGEGSETAGRAGRVRIPGSLQAYSPAPGCRRETVWSRRAKPCEHPSHEGEAMFRNRRQGRGLFVALTTIFTAMFVGVAATPASAGENYNNAEVNITGGKAHALSACVNYAKLKAK